MIGIVVDLRQQALQFLLLDDGDVRTVRQHGIAGRGGGRCGRVTCRRRCRFVDDRAVGRRVGQDDVGILVGVGLLVRLHRGRVPPHVRLAVQLRHRYEVIGQGLRCHVQLLGRPK